ncbi:MAG: AmmeMemoRadiSam system protein B [Anaerolineales bacterium]|nr:AmmeMemoRadiSam system protein B [Anaerolineales bacterium]
MSDLRPSPIAGTWYPGNPDALRQSIESQLALVDPKPPEGEIVGVIAPHAGHRYSGGVAAHAFRILEGLEPEVVAVISPLHSPYPGDVFTTDHDAYSTPLGEIPIARDILDRLESLLEDPLKFVRLRNDSEHSLEIELPFLQEVIKRPFKLLPLMVLKQTKAVTEILGHALAQTLNDEVSILVASSDLSHFYPAAIAHQYDTEVLKRIEAFDPVSVITAEEEGVGFACGRGAVATVLWAAKDLGANKVEILAYAHSGDVTGDNSSVVGYGAAAILQTHE